MDRNDRREQEAVRNEIHELDANIGSFLAGEIDEERFKGFRLARGIYGQRQTGVQMVRIKLPFGRITTTQLHRIADISDEYSTGNIHLTTRQDIQLHFVGLSRTPRLWEELAEAGMTIREACGNTVRNVTASPIAGIDPSEPFDVSPYAYATFRYFLRNPICQDLGRKFKIAFASGPRDTAFTFIHDVGLIPLVRRSADTEERGFKVVIGGGLGAQPSVAATAYEFLPEDRLIPFIEALLRVFDRHGERTNRNKARMKYLLKEIGIESLLKLVEEERTALTYQSYPIAREEYSPTPRDDRRERAATTPADTERYRLWHATNTFEQKQRGFHAVQIRVPLGNLTSGTARALADIARRHADDDIRITINQGLLLRFVPEALLPDLYGALDRIGLAEHGFDTTADITACPGTDTCNLGISNSTGIALELERVIATEYPDFATRNDITIKISGCMNSCGQHGLATIGLHGSSLKHGDRVVPALQVMIGGGTLGNGEGRLAERIIKVPSRRGPDALRTLLDDYTTGSEPGEPYLRYFDRRGKSYFQRLLRPFAELATLTPDDYVDWGAEGTFVPSIGIGECASVTVDLVSVLVADADGKYRSANDALARREWADSIYLGYSAMVTTAKAFLLREELSCSTQGAIIEAFDERFTELPLTNGFRETVLAIRENEPSEEFATRYVREAERLIDWATERL